MAFPFRDTPMDIDRRLQTDQLYSLKSASISLETAISAVASLSGLGVRFVEVVVLVVLRPLKRQLKRNTILGDLVDIYARGNFDSS